MIPDINKTYNCFDDGKIRESRKYQVTIKEIIYFDDIDKETLDYWTEEVKTCYWLYDEKTDFFIKTINSDNEDEVFVRTKDSGWFSIGCGRLDVDGKLTDALN